MATRDTEPSIIEYFYEPKGPSGHRCGYCGDETGFVSNGMWAHRLTCEDYKNLIDRGWRRSGKYCYKPQNDKMCCPLYTISCGALNFVLSKSQKKALIKFRKYLETDSIKDTPKKMDAVASSQCRKKEKTHEKKQTGHVSSSGEGAIDTKKTHLVSEAVSETPSKLPTSASCLPLEEPSKSCSEVHSEKSFETESTSDKSSKVDTTLSHTSMTTQQKSTPPTEQQTEPKSQSPTKTATDVPTKLSAKMPPGKNSKASNFDLPSHVGKKKIGKEPKEQQQRKTIEEFLTVDSPMIGKAHRLDVKLVRSSPPSPEFERMFEESYAVYKKYQMAIHHDKESDCDQKQFKRFLVDSPLTPCPSEGTGPDYGSYHCHYYLDGRLFMVGVLDVLPGCLSSVYLFYDPTFGFLVPGTFSALYEIAYTRSLARCIQGLDQYYMGYYVHNCQKMKYKGNFSPSFLLCPETYQWQPIERCLVQLDHSKYARFVGEQEDKMEEVESYVLRTQVLFQRQAIPFAILKALSVRKLNCKVTEYARLVGKEVASSMLLYIDDSDIIQ